MIGKKSLIMLDEPMLGLMPKIVQRLVDVVTNIKKEMSVILVEQSIDTALDLADRVYIMRDGTIAFKGLPDEVRKNKDVEDLLVLK
jgi:branched-chain amino acid transport system ATP-binding protein